MEMGCVLKKRKRECSVKVMCRAISVEKTMKRSNKARERAYAENCGAAAI